MKALMRASLAFILMLAGCQHPESVTAGGWASVKDGEITEDLQELFDKAMENQTEVQYVPIELLATQVVAGTKYRFLCEAKIIGEDSGKRNVVVVIYKDLSGNVEVTSITESH